MQTFFKKQEMPNAALLLSLFFSTNKRVCSLFLSAVG